MARFAVRKRPSTERAHRPASQHETGMTVSAPAGTRMDEFTTRDCLPPRISSPSSRNAGKGERLSTTSERTRPASSSSRTCKRSAMPGVARLVKRASDELPVRGMRVSSPTVRGGPGTNGAMESMRA